MSEVIREVDLRIALSHLAQSNYATALTGANLGAGKSYRPTAPILPEIQKIYARRGAHVFTGHEFPNQENEIEILRDLQFPLSFTADPFLLAWAGAFCLNKVTSVQEGATTHYTHTIIPSDPLAGSGTRDTKVTSVYFDSGGPDAGRRKAIFPSLAIVAATLNIRKNEPITLSMDLIGSGKEDTATAVTIPALTADVPLLGTNVKIEIGDTGGGLTDYTARFREMTIRFFQEAAADLGYQPVTATPSDGKFRSTLQFRRRGAEINAVIEIDRSSTALRTRWLNRTRSEIKVTQDSGVLAGTGTDNYGFEFRVPDCRFMEIPVNFDAGDGVYAIQIGSEDMYRSSGIGNVPFELKVENIQSSYFA